MHNKMSGPTRKMFRIKSGSQNMYPFIPIKDSYIVVAKKYIRRASAF